jgi:hypothetical protein
MVGKLMNSFKKYAENIFLVPISTLGMAYAWYLLSLE